VVVAPTPKIAELLKMREPELTKPKESEAKIETPVPTPAKKIVAKLMNPFEANLAAEKEAKAKEEAERSELLRKKKLEAENKRKAKETADKAEKAIMEKLAAKKAEDIRLAAEARAEK
jgi:hypothetical protein